MTMRRRGFRASLGAVLAVPALPSLPMASGQVAGAVAVGYNRYQYGLAVFHARTRVAVNAADLAKTLRVSVGTAEAMVGEMRAAGVIAPVLRAGSVAFRAVDAVVKPRLPGVVVKARAQDMLDNLARIEPDLTDHPEADQSAPEDNPHIRPGADAPEAEGDDNGKV